MVAAQRKANKHAIACHLTETSRNFKNEISKDGKIRPMLEPETDNKMQTFLSGPFCSHTMPTIAVAAFCACIFMPAAQAVAMVPSPRQHLILSSGWRFLQQDVERCRSPASMTPSGPRRPTSSIYRNETVCIPESNRAT